MLERREFLGLTAAGAGIASAGLGAEPRPATKRAAVIDITDLYHPSQDVGDNLDLVAAFALPEVDLKAVILDVTARFREPVAGPPGDPYQDATGPRDPGFIPVWQLNALFGRNVPCAVGPYGAMRSPADPMRDAPAFQQHGVELMLKVLRESAEPVHVVSFGSARPLAVAWNREPELLRRKVACAICCAGAAPTGYLEWNVMLDVAAFVRLLRSDLPLALYPCATDKGPFDVGPNNTFWKLLDLGFLRDLSPGLRRYAALRPEPDGPDGFSQGPRARPAGRASERDLQAPAQRLGNRRLGRGLRPLARSPRRRHPPLDSRRRARTCRHDPPRRSETLPSHRPRRRPVHLQAGHGIEPRPHLRAFRSARPGAGPPRGVAGLVSIVFHRMTALTHVRVDQKSTAA